MNEHAELTQVCRTVRQAGALTTALKPNKRNTMQNILENEAN